ncbi:MAG: neuromedin U, partial [Nitrospirota bacterium]
FNVFDLEAIWAKRLGKWGVVNRLNIPLVYLPSSAPPSSTGDSGSTFGLGDILYTAFLARDESQRIFKAIGGIGPTILFNSSTDDRIGTGKWGIGPSAAVTSKPGRWVNGLLVNQIWSFAGDADREDLSFLVLRPFINYNVWNGWYLTTTPLITANWKATERNKWSVPIGGGVGKIALKVGKQPLNFRIQGFYFIEKADLAPDWTLNFEFQILFPQYDVEPSSETYSED